MKCQILLSYGRAYQSIFLHPSQVKKLRTTTGHADPYKWEYLYNGVTCLVKVQPALIEQKDGSYKAFFPSVTEEFIEEALKKILTDQKYGRHDPVKGETWVRVFVEHDSA